MPAALVWLAAVAIGYIGLLFGGVGGCVGGLALAVAIALLCLVGPFFVRRRTLIRQFKRDFAGRWLLVCSRRRQWGQFIDNNVLTVLPEGVHVVWYDPRRTGQPYPASALQVLGLGNVANRPYLIRYAGRRPEIHLLHEKLLELSHSTKRDPRVSSQVRSVLLDIVKDA